MKSICTSHSQWTKEDFKVQKNIIIWKDQEIINIRWLQDKTTNKLLPDQVKEITIQLSNCANRPQIGKRYKSLT